jgi:hypothetical protein
MADEPTTSRKTAAIGAPIPHPKPAPRLRRLLGKRITLAVLLFLLLAAFLKDREFFEPSYEDIYQEFQSILGETLKLSESNASDAEWDKFEQDAQRRLATISDELLELCKRNPTARRTTFGSQTSDDVSTLIRRPLLQIGQYNLPRLIRNGRSKERLKHIAAQIQTEMQDIRKSLDAVNGRAKPNEH